VSNGESLLSEVLREARRRAEAIRGVELLADFRWFPEVACWGLHYRITIESKNLQFVPHSTNWWVIVEPRYPLGKIKVYPASEGGITATFPHQSYNGFDKHSLPWRSGDLCLRTPNLIFGKAAYDSDPIGSPLRLMWYLQRAIKWLESANAGELLASGQPFELPSFPYFSLQYRTVAFTETDATFARWMETDVRYGIAELAPVNDQHQTFVVDTFKDARGLTLQQSSLGSELSSPRRGRVLAVWIRCGFLPVMLPYQAPHIWSELRSVFSSKGDSLDELLRPAFNLVRDGTSHLFLLGFPVSRRVGDDAHQIHWQPILLPTVSYGIHYARGFRANAEGYWRRDRMEVVAPNDPIEWQLSANWSKEDSTVRGTFSGGLKSQRIAVIGIGAVGAAVSELLVRGGVDDLLLVDEDRLEHGNLCRHLLTMQEIDKNKAQGIASRLNSARAQARVRVIASDFPDIPYDRNAEFNNCNLIVECTGADETLIALADYEWPDERLFCSISLSYAANRVYVYLARGNGFPMSEFRRKVLPWLRRDVEEFGNNELPREGIGCWHAAFPARIDSVWMLCAAAVKRLDEWAGNGFADTGLTVYEQVSDHNRFLGIIKKDG
jgi:hypothetical protein